MDQDWLRAATALPIEPGWTINTFHDARRGAMIIRLCHTTGRTEELTLHDEELWIDLNDCQRRFLLWLEQVTVPEATTRRIDLEE
jgi:hypothetical protein